MPDTESHDEPRRGPCITTVNVHGLAGDDVAVRRLGSSIIGADTVVVELGPVGLFVTTAEAAEVGRAILAGVDELIAEDDRR